MSLFNRIKIRTPESVELEFTLAGIGNRTIALLVDYLVWGAILFAVLVVRAILQFQLQRYLGNIENEELWLQALTILIVFGVYTGYFTFFETLWQGQTPGKRYAKIRVIRDDGQPVGVSQALLRSLLRPFDDSFFLGALMIILSKREKRLGDWAAGTLVIQEERAIAEATFPISEEARSLSEELLKTTNISALLPDDFAVIREFLQRRYPMDKKARANLSSQLADQARRLIGLQELQFQPELFLEAIYLAYQQQSHH